MEDPQPGSAEIVGQSRPDRLAATRQRA
jgi:hypothetical protein